MGLFNKKKKEEVMPLPEELPQIEEPAPVIEEEKPATELMVQETPVAEDKEEPVVLGINVPLVNKIKDKVEKLKEERSKLESDYTELINRLSIVEGKCDAINNTFKNFKGEIMSSFLESARSELKKEMKVQNDASVNNHSRIMKIEDELIKMSKAQEEFEFVSSFQDYYQLIKLCIYMMTHADANNHSLISLLLQTVHSLIDDMRRNNFWETGRDAIITSLLNLKTYWRARDARIEGLIGSEINALETLR